MCSESQNDNFAHLSHKLILISLNWMTHMTTYQTNTFLLFEQYIYELSSTTKHIFLICVESVFLLSL